MAINYWARFLEMAVLRSQNRREDDALSHFEWGNPSQSPKCLIEYPKVETSRSLSQTRERRFSDQQDMGGNASVESRVGTTVQPSANNTAGLSRGMSIV
jgi:hypothetical protein